MVVMATVEIDPSTIEEINEIVQDLSTGCSLNNGESRLGPASRESSLGS